ncbi:unnamed protein product [Ixodes hexagonus]
MAVRGPRATPVGLPQAMSPESALASDIFDQFVSAGTFKAALSTYRQASALLALKADMCDVLQLSPSPLPSFYPRLKAKLRSWRAASLWAKLDKRAAHKCYNRGKACAGMRVLIIGGGPCGIRAAIEAQLLGAKVVVLEKRDRYSRNNVLHLWPFVIHDLRALGAKKFFGKFCAGSIDHISIRQLQLILLKVALLLGVEVHENVTFKDLLEPPEDQSQERISWRAQVLPADHPASQYEFDVLIGADGKRNTLKGKFRSFNRKEFRGKLAIAITANFMNRHTLEEARVQEISGVAFIFNQKFFQDMRESTGIDLENIVYYKDDTHYFVMTAKKQSLLDRGVIINDYSDTASLLSPENVDRAALTEYARDAADFATGYALPSLEFAVNHYGQADVAMFDFTSMYAADNACRLLERRGHWLLQGLVGDCLLEPFWPTGSGCARGFLSSLDAAWMMRSWAMNKDSPLHVLAERESIYRLLAQTTPENLSKDLGEYSLNPSSRYPNLNLQAVLPSQVRSLCRTDTEICLPPLGPRPLTEMQKKRRRRESIIHPDALLSWCQRQVALYSRIKIENMTSSWKDGLALCAILHRYRPDLIDLDELSGDNIAANNQRAFDILEREYGIPPVMTGQEMVDCTVPDKLTMVSYVSQIYETFRREIPQGRPAYKVSKLIEENQLPPTAPLNLLSKISQKIQGRKKYSTEQDTSTKDKSDSQSQKKARISITRSRRSRDRTALDALAGGEPSALTHYEKILSALDRESFGRRMQALQEQLAKDERASSRGSRGRRSGHASSATEDESSSVPGGRARVPRSAVQRLQDQLNSGSSSSAAKRKENKVGRLGKDEWNVKMLEERLKQQQKKAKEPKVEVEKPRVFKDIFESKLSAMDARLKAGGGLTEKERARYSGIDERLQRLDKQLKEGSLDVGTRGANRVAAMAGYIANVLDAQTGIREKRPPPPPPVVLFRNDAADGTQTPPLAASPVPLPAASSEKGPEAVSETCCFCHKRVYLMERLSAEGLFFHRSCFRCDYCQGSLRLGNYAYDRTTPFKGKFYCPAHFRMERPSERWQEMMKRKQAFLSANPEPPSLMPSSAPSAATSALEDSTAAVVHQHHRQSPSPPYAGAGEGMGDPAQMGSAITPPAAVVDAGTMTFQAKTYKVPRQLTAEEVATMMDVDSTPERVEFENSLELLSEDDLLTSELEEEELAQKNLGAVDVATSDDEYSDLSSEEGSESESLVEEIEHSLTLDDTRQMAETWQRKHASSLDTVGEGAAPEQGNGLHAPLLDRRAQLGCPEDEEEEEDSGTEGEEDYDEGEDEEETETETGDEDATSQDIDSDEEYSPPEVLSNDEDGIARSHRHENGRDEEVTVPVPVLNMDKKLSNEAGSSTEDSGDEYISDEEGITISSSELSSESEEEPPPPKHEIPVIVIDVSPGDQDTELDWGPQEVRAALGQPPAEVPEAELKAGPETQPETMSPVITTVPTAASFSKLESAETTSASPKSSDGQTSSDQLSLQQLTKLAKSSESLPGMSASSGLSSSSNVDDLSENAVVGVHAAREAIAFVVEDLGSLTDVSDVSSAVQRSESVESQPPSNMEQPFTDSQGYDLLLDRAGSSGSSSLPTPADEVGPSSTGSESSAAVHFGRLAGRESGASSSLASSSHRSASSVGDGGDESEDSEYHKPFMVSDCGSPWSPTGDSKPVVAYLEHPAVSRTASGSSEHSEDALLSVSGRLCPSERPDSSETSTADTVEDATVLQRRPSKEAENNDELSPTGSILDQALSSGLAETALEEPGCRLSDGSLEMARLNDRAFASALCNMGPQTSVLEVEGTVMPGLQEMPEKKGDVNSAVLAEAPVIVPDYVEAGLDGEGLLSLDRLHLTLDLDVGNVPEQEGVALNILSPQSDVTDEDTTCSASISDQEVFPADDNLPKYEEHVVTPDLQERPKSGLFAPIASMSDEDDLTASDAGKRTRRLESEPLVEKVILETTEELCETPQDFLTTPVNAEPVVTHTGHPSDEDDFTVSEWAREGGEKEVLSVLEDLNPEFHFDDRNVTRRRKKKRPLSGNQNEPQEGVEQGKSEPGEQACVRFEDNAQIMVSPDRPDMHAATTERDVRPLVREPPKFQGYGGSFAEKVRGRPSDGDSSSRDSIYLKSLNINLQRMEFPSIRSSSPSSRGSCEELDSDSSVTVQSTPVQRSAPIAIERHVKSAESRTARPRPQQFPETFHTPAQSKSQLRPCPDPVTAMLMSRRELARKSVHEDIQNLPYFDSQSLAGDYEDFKTPECGTPTEAFETPPTSRPGWIHSASGCTNPDRERARREARERARLKSDEELGLSPCSYRRKYARTPAFDEITLTDLLDQEDETFNALDDRSSLRSFSTAQHRLAQFEDDDDFVVDDDEATPVASPARSMDELDRPDDDANPSTACAIVPMDPYQIRADVWKPKPKPKRRLFAKNDEDDRKQTPPTTAKRNLLSFLGFSRNSSGDASSGTTKEKKESYNREKAAKDVADNDRSRTFSRLRLTKSRSDKAAQKKVSSSVGSSGGTSSTEKADVAASRLDDQEKRVVGSVSHQRRPLPLEELKKHISLDNLKSQPIQLPAKSRSVEFGCLAPRAAEEDSLLDFDDRDIDAAGECGGLSDKKGKAVDQRRLERLTLRVQRQQELKRLRTAQEIQRRLEEIEVSLRALERRGVLIERALRGEDDDDEDLRTDEKDLTQVLFRLMRQKNKLSREEQELLIRVKDLELENHHSKLQQEMRERMAVDDKEKSPRDIEKERQILSEMLEIVEKRDRLVAQMDQLRIRYVHTEWFF